MMIFFDASNGHRTKQEVLQQVAQFDLVVSAKGFFNIDRRFAVAVSSLAEL